MKRGDVVLVPQADIRQTIGVLSPSLLQLLDEAIKAAFGIP
jgi:hypothetical protein